MLSNLRRITRFLPELGAGFAYAGRQVHLEVGGEDFFFDLLFYQLRPCYYVVVKFEAGAFKPEHAGKLNCYLAALDAQVKSEHDGPTIGLLLCESKNKVVAEYALLDTNKSIGVAEYQLIEALPRDMPTGLPSIEAIEQGLAGDDGGCGSCGRAANVDSVRVGWPVRI